MFSLPLCWLACDLITAGLVSLRLYPSYHVYQCNMSLWHNALHPTTYLRVSCDLREYLSCFFTDLAVSAIRIEMLEIVPRVLEIGSKNCLQI